ncbi:MAG TPA: cytochrome C oxidase subunit IV family protein [Candidatus Kapabacteria bacterium]|nr:cytochrome C oxidase subunit IV family protein [Candidatus Kapabacteria bacterium]
MSPIAVLIACWLGLVLLSVTTVLLGSSGSSGLLTAGILLAALGKGWIIIDRFMELRHTRSFWRPLLLAWPVLMAVVVGFGLLMRP